MKLYFLTLFLAIVTITTAQSNHKADELLKEYKYAEAIVELKPLADKGNTQAIRKIAECYRKINDYVNAEKYYAIVVADKNTNTKNYLYYGQMLMNNSKYKDATKWLTTYIATKPHDSLLIKNMISSCEKAEQENNPVRKVIFSNYTAINSPQSDFCAVDYNDAILFTSAREGKINGWDGQSYAKVFIAEKTSDSVLKIDLMKGPVNSKNVNSGPACVDIRNNKIYYTKNNFQYGNTTTNKKGDVTLKLFEAKLDDDNVKNFKELSCNDVESSSAYPSISKEGNKLFFTSDRPGGYGGKDIYYSLLQNGVWSKPKNVGKTVNTQGDERYPFVHDDGSLYFSSNGHAGFGGMDVFRATLTVNGEYNEPENLGIPFNSSSDDFGFFLDSLFKNGYISSDRPGGKGSDDIYKFTYEDIPISYSIYYNNQLQDSVQIILTEISNKESKTFFSNKGKWNYFLLPNKEYNLQFIKEGLAPTEQKIITKEIAKPITKKISME